MTPARLPAAAYGKAIDRRDEYCILWHQSGFGETAQQALRRVARSYQFLGDSGRDSDRYPDSFALWRVDAEGSWLALRLRDAGSDSLRRPHTLRIDAVLIDAYTAAGHRDQLLGFLEACGWPKESFDAGIELTSLPCAASQVVTAALAEFSPMTATASILRAGHTQGTNRFDIVLNAEGHAESVQREGSSASSGAYDNSWQTPSAPPVPQLGRPMPNTTHRRSGSWLRTFLACIVAGVLGGGAGYFWTKLESDEAFRKLEASFHAKEEGYKAERVTLERDLKAAQVARDDYLAKARQLQADTASYKKVAEAYGLTNPHDLEKKFQELGLPQQGGTGESEKEKILRLLESARIEADRLPGVSEGSPVSAGAPDKPDKQEPPVVLPLGGGISR